MKTAKLIDRFVNDRNQHVLKVQDERGFMNVIVALSDADEAAQIGGGSPVHFTRSGSQWRYVNDAEWYGDDE